MCGHKITTTATNNSDFFQTEMTDQELTHLTLKLINRRLDDDEEGGYINILENSSHSYNFLSRFAHKFLK